MPGHGKFSAFHRFRCSFVDPGLPRVMAGTREIRGKCVLPTNFTLATLTCLVHRHGGLQGFLLPRAIFLGGSLENGVASLSPARIYPSLLEKQCMSGIFLRPVSQAWRSVHTLRGCSCKQQVLWNACWIPPQPSNPLKHPPLPQAESLLFHMKPIILAFLYAQRPVSGSQSQDRGFAQHHSER